MHDYLFQFMVLVLGSVVASMAGVIGKTITGKLKKILDAIADNTKLTQDVIDKLDDHEGRISDLETIPGKHKVKTRGYHYER